MKKISVILCALLLLGLSRAQAQDQKGPISPPPGVTVQQIPLHSTPAPPPLPPEEIVHRFTANEDKFSQAFQNYTYHQSIRVEQMADDGSVLGEFRLTGLIYMKPDGAHYFRVMGEPTTTLRGIKFTAEDVETLADLPLFPLTTEQSSWYNFNYEGRQQLDELNTYIFRITPKQMEGRRRYFTGVVWVDDHDLVIVKSYGQFVTETPPQGVQLPFKLFETYRENIDGKYWFPTYTRSDDFAQAATAQLPVRLIVRSTEFQRVSAPATAATPPAQSPPAKQPQR